VQRLDEVRAELTEASEVEGLLEKARRDVAPQNAELIAGWPAVVESYSGDEQVVSIRGKEIRNALTRESLSGH
jgi:methylmalonyl-CoA mutase